MSKEEFLKIQTCVLKVNIHCDGCKRKVKKLLQKIDGVYTTSIDAEQGRVTVSGNVDPATLIKKLAKAGKHAELWASKSGGVGGGGGGGQNPHFNLAGQFPNQQLQVNGKPPKGGGGGGGGGKDQKGQQHPLPAALPQLNPQQQQQLLQQMKGFKDLKLPNLSDPKLAFPPAKDPKSVKFSLPPENEESDYDDDYDNDDSFDDDDDFDDLEGFDDDFEDDFGRMKLPPTGAPPTNMKANANGKKGDTKNPGAADAAAANNAGGKKGGGNDKNGGGKPEAKNGGNGNRGNHCDGNGDGHGNNGNSNNHGGNKAGGLGLGHPMVMGQGFPDMGQMGPATAVHGLPAGAIPGGFLPGRMAAQPEIITAANPYQQQYIAAMMQQQRMMNPAAVAAGYDPRMYPGVSYGRPMAPAYFAPPPAGEPYTHFFSDENTNSCSIM